MLSTSFRATSLPLLENHAPLVSLFYNCAPLLKIYWIRTCRAAGIAFQKDGLDHRESRSGILSRNWPPQLCMIKKVGFQISRSARFLIVLVRRTDCRQKYWKGRRHSRNERRPFNSNERFCGSKRCYIINPEHHFGQCKGIYCLDAENSERPTE